eukprot:350980-Chlamydomonas_euryale.AAC.4
MQQRYQAPLAKAQAEQLSIWRSCVRCVPPMGHLCAGMPALHAGQTRPTPYIVWIYGIYGPSSTATRIYRIYSIYGIRVRPSLDSGQASPHPYPSTLTSSTSSEVLRCRLASAASAGCGGDGSHGPLSRKPAPSHGLPSPLWAPSGRPPSVGPSGVEPPSVGPTGGAPGVRPAAQGAPSSVRPFDTEPPSVGPSGVEPPSVGPGVGAPEVQGGGSKCGAGRYGGFKCGSGRRSAGGAPLVAAGPKRTSLANAWAGLRCHAICAGSGSTPSYA